MWAIYEDEEVGESDFDLVSLYIFSFYWLYDRYLCRKNGRDSDSDGSMRLTRYRETGTTSKPYERPMALVTCTAIVI